MPTTEQKKQTEKATSETVAPSPEDREAQLHEQIDALVDKQYDLIDEFPTPTSRREMRFDDGTYIYLQHGSAQVVIEAENGQKYHYNLRINGLKNHSDPIFDSENLIKSRLFISASKSSGQYDEKGNPIREENATEKLGIKSNEDRIAHANKVLSFIEQKMTEETARHDGKFPVNKARFESGAIGKENFLKKHGDKVVIVDEGGF